MKTNLDFNPDELLSNLKNMKRGQKEVRRNSFATKEPQKGNL